MNTPLPRRTGSQLPRKTGSPLKQFYNDVVRKYNPLLADTKIIERSGTSSDLVGVIPLPPGLIESQKRVRNLIEMKLRSRGLHRACKVELGREPVEQGGPIRVVLKIKYYAGLHEMQIEKLRKALGRPSADSEKARRVRTRLNYQLELAQRFAAKIGELPSGS